MSPIRGDVKKNSSPPLRREMNVVACIQPNLSSGEAVGAPRIPDRPSQLMVACIQPNLRSGEAVGAPRIPDRPSQLMVSTRRFHDAMVVRRLRFRKLRKQEGWLK